MIQTIDPGMTQTMECLPTLRWLTRDGWDGPERVLQQAWRVSWHSDGMTGHSEIQWFDVPDYP